MGGTGSGGQNRKPQRLHQLGGTYRANRHSRRLADVPAGELGAAAMPKSLGKEGRKFWRTYAPLLEARGLLTVLDGPAFSLVCRAWERLQEIDQQLADEGAIVEGPRGGTRAHPAVRMRATWERSFRDGLAQFGLTPLSRQRVPVSEPEPEDELERLLRESEDAATGRRPPLDTRHVLEEEYQQP